MYRPDAPRVRANRLLEGDALEELRELAKQSNDSYVRRRLAMLYTRRGDISSLRELAKVSNRGGRHYIEYLAEQGHLDQLLQQVVAGDGMAARALRDWPVKGLDDDTRRKILTEGLHPNGTPVSAK